MYKLGITGGIGSGKSTAADYFLQKGAVIFDADKEAKQHLLSHIDLQNIIIDTFGTQVTRENHLDLLKLSKYVFTSKKYQNTLNQIIWPEIYDLIISTAEKAARDGFDLFVIDAALLLESGYKDFCDSILLITAHQSIRIRRIRLRKNIPENQIEKRMALQMPESEKQEQTQTTIENNGNILELHTQLDQFWEKLNIS